MQKIIKQIFHFFSFLLKSIAKDLVIDDETQEKMERVESKQREIKKHAQLEVIKVDFIKPKRFVNRVFLHCSSSDLPEQDSLEAIKELHTGPTTKEFRWGKYKTNGKDFNDIGYHFVITKDGEIHKGRSLEVLPAAQAEHNPKTIAICLTGENAFNKSQFESLKALCRAINKAYNRDITFHGHCEVSQKLCPVFDYKKVLGLNKKGYLVKDV